jgi:hypothetical protein
MPVGTNQLQLQKTVTVREPSRLERNDNTELLKFCLPHSAVRTPDSSQAAFKKNPTHLTSSGQRPGESMSHVRVHLRLGPGLAAK